MEPVNKAELSTLRAELAAARAEVEKLEERLQINTDAYGEERVHLLRSLDMSESRLAAMTSARDEALKERDELDLQLAGCAAVQEAQKKLAEAQCRAARAQVEQIAKTLTCEHKRRSGGNDYIECSDCGLMWDYRKEGPQDALRRHLTTLAQSFGGSDAE